MSELFVDHTGEARRIMSDQFGNPTILIDERVIQGELGVTGLRIFEVLAQLISEHVGLDR